MRSGVAQHRPEPSRNAEFRYYSGPQIGQEESGWSVPAQATKRVTTTVKLGEARRYRAAACRQGSRAGPRSLLPTAWCSDEVHPWP